jgi:glyoxylase-like metal-dependent hydrolase (beta-lactamase superfamily II)
VEGPESLVVVDLGSNSDIPLVDAAARWLGKPVAMIVPTHLHFDHIVGIEKASVFFKAVVGLSSPAYNLVQKGTPSKPPIWITTIRHFVIPWVWQGLPGQAKGDLPGGLEFGFPWSKNPFTRMNRELKDGDPVPFLDGWVSIFTPGHTNECVSLYHPKAGFLICGDTIRNFQGGEWDPIVTSPEAFERTKERLRKLDNIQALFFGHGPVSIKKGIIGSLKTKGVW